MTTENTNTTEQKILTPVEEKLKKDKEKEESDELIKKNLNNHKFLAFLAKDKDSVGKATDDDYIKLKIEVFENVQKVKGEVKKYITAESTSGYAGIVDDSFITGLEDMAIKKPDVFIEFSTKITEYLESVEKIKALEGVYQKASNALNIKGNFAELKGSEKKKLVNDIHAEIDSQTSNAETGLVDADKKLSDIEENRTKKSYFRFLKDGKEYKKEIGKTNEEVALLKTSLESLKTNASALNKESMLLILTNMEKIKTDLNGNEAFRKLLKSFDERAKIEMDKAKAAKNYSVLARNMADLKKSRINETLLDDEKYENMEKDLVEYSKKETKANATELFDKKGEVTLNVFEKGIDKLREDGEKLGLTKEECDVEIKAKFQEKVELLEKNPGTGQNTIKLILAKRILANL